MGLLKKIFGDRAGRASGPASSQFHESETTTEQGPNNNAPRRELVQVVLRDTMRKHGIPSDWIDCRILSVVSRRATSGMHVSFIVRHGEESLLTYVHAFQDSFWREIEKFEPRATEWLFSLTWQFEGRAPQRSMPDPAMWTGTAPTVAGVMETEEDEDVQRDLQALFAIRDAAMRDPAPDPGGQVDFQPTRPGT